MIPAIPLPTWSMRVLLAVLVLAFPIIVLLAWVFQESPTGVVEREALQLQPREIAFLGVVTLLIGAALGLLWVTYHSRGEEVAQFQRPGVAVLPLKDMSPGGDKVYFSDGVQEELISRLSEIRHIAVTSRTSVDRYRDSKLTAREIADELAVDYILEGSVRHSTDRVRITVQLIDAVKDEHVWVREFDKRLSMDELFDIQRDVSENIASLMRTQLTPSDLQRLARVPTDSLAAYEAHLKAVYHYRRYNEQDLRIAIEHWENAVRLDPNYADAFSGLANGYMLAATTYGWMQPEQAIRLAKQYGARALEMTPYSGGIISLIGDIAYWYDYDAETAEAKYLEGIAVDPHHIGNRLSFAYFLSTQGRHDEAKEQIDYCLAKEPRAAHLHANAAWRYVDARQYEKVIEHANIALSLEPELIDPTYAKAYALLLTDRIDEAEPMITGHWPLTALFLMRSGREAEARDYAYSLMREPDKPADVSLVFAIINDADETIRQLNKAIDERHRSVLLINSWELYDPLRADPRFHAVLRRLGFDSE